MDDELDLPEGDDINLDLDTAIPDVAAAQPAEEGDDFNLDDFLSEEDKNTSVGSELNLENMFANEPQPAEQNDLPDETAVAEDDATKPNVETENPSAELTESDVLAEAAAPAALPEENPEPVEDVELAENSGEAAIEETDVVNGKETAEENGAFAESAKGWAFENEEESSPTQPETDLPAEETGASAETSGGYDMPEPAGFAHWFSGNRDEGAFELDKNSLPAVLQGDAEHRVLHVNVGYDTYGWVVQFDNGICMNLRDVREYQLRNGNLPSSNGKISYGEMQTEFSAIEKITIYESVRYFTYA